MRMCACACVVFITVFYALVYNLIRDILYQHHYNMHIRMVNVEVTSKAPFRRHGHGKVTKVQNNT